jgi:hypothetical protein
MIASAAPPIAMPAIAPIPTDGLDSLDSCGLAEVEEEGATVTKEVTSVVWPPDAVTVCNVV